MKNKTPIILALTAFVANQLHDAHLLALDVEKRTAIHPAAEARLPCCLPHGNEPEQPGWPLPAPTVMLSTSTSTASTSFAMLPGG